MGVTAMKYKYEIIRINDNLPVKIITHTADNQLFIPRHWHESVEISYVLSGKIDEIYIDGKTYVSQQEDIVLINSNAIHSFSVTKEKKQKAVTILIPYEFVKAIYPDSNKIVFDCISIEEKDIERKTQFDELRTNLNSILYSYEDKENNPLAYIRITSLSYELIYILLKNFKIDKRSNDIIKTGKYLDRLTMITDFIKENYNHNLSIELLANEFNLSSEYLSRFFKKHTGMTIFNYISAIRLEKSYSDLMNTNYPLLKIALNHGFPNEKSYNKVFKAVYDVTPNQYRKERRGIKSKLK